MRTPTNEVPARARLARFDGAEMALHWVNAGLFGILIVTAAILYVGQLSALVGRRELVRYLHVVSGLALPFPLLAARYGPWRRAFVADVRALARFDDDDRRWLRSFGRAKDVRMGKFHPGQKLNAAFTLGAIIVMLATGSIMHWFRFFPVDWRTGATFVHDWLALALAVVIVGHLKMALADPDARRGMTQGWVPTIWARRHRPKWYEEVTGRASRGGEPPETG
ncbi:MAG TPA: cytochrome b/b6 domain-containing protein [Acidimicrobiales bacterium]|nr:cytochrome b/b6 domain-containing protein [Acidimicrobiales bacterium]